MNLYMNSELKMNLFQYELSLKEKILQCIRKSSDGRVLTTTLIRSNGIYNRCEGGYASIFTYFTYINHVVLNYDSIILPLHRKSW